jgi:potassium efflux system protein
MSLFRLALLTLALVGSFPQVASAQPQVPPSSETPAAPADALEITIESVERQKSSLQESKELDDAAKAKLVELYNNALEALRIAERDAERLKDLEQKAQAAPTLVQELKAELAKPAADVKPEVADDATLTQLQQSQSEAEANLAGWQKTLSDVEQEAKRRAERRVAAPQELAAARGQLEDVQKQLAVPPAPEESPHAVAAARTYLLARKKAVEAAIRALEREPNSYEARAESLALRRDQSTRNVAQADKLVKAWQNAVNQRRRAEVDRQAREAREAAARADPAVSEKAEENSKLAELRKSLASTIERVTRENEEVDKRLAELEGDFTSVTEKEKRVGLTEAIGLLLRKQRADLPKVAERRRRIAERQSEIAHLELQLIDYEDARSRLADLQSEVDRILKELEGPIPPNEDDYIEAELRSVLETKRSYLDSLISDSNTYMNKLVDLDTNEHQLVLKTGEYLAYIDERILWVQSTSPLRLLSRGKPPDDTPSDLRVALDAVAWLIDPYHWAASGLTLWSDAWANRGAYLLALLVFAVLLASQRRRRRSLRQASEQASKGYVTSMLPTLEALALTVSLALPAALWLAFLGWRLDVAGVTEFDKATGAGLLTMAAVLLSLEFFRQVCRTKGLGECHFRWSPASLSLARGTLWQLIVAGLPLGFVVTALAAGDNEARHNSLGRLVFIATMVLLAVCLRRVLRPTGGVLQHVLAHNRGGWIDRLRHVWYPAAVAMPVFLAVLAASGYYFTALQLAWQFLLTLWLALGLLLVTALILRWLQLTYRALAIKQARERRAAVQSEAKEPGAAPEADGSPSQPALPEFDLSTVNVQTRKLLRIAVSVALLVGLWLVWADVLPALGFLKRVELWSISVVGTDNVPTTVWINLADVLLAAAVAALTVAASRNVPGLLEMVVLQRLPLEPGARFAITTVSRYSITVVGVVVAFAAIGIGWSKVQWLVAAMTVGLGFGLQEIFANFVSGLILLMERPIRVGDIVTVGEVTGKVSRIRIRATTVTDWDLRELIVPNKEFVTGQIINWTLSDTLSRMTIHVGVAYGSDTKRTYDLLLKVADEHPLVLKEPAPHALLDGFGNSTLNFTLRVYMASRDIYLQLRHDLHVAIDNALRNAGIEIAFPQRDLHIRSIDEAVRVASNGTAARAKRKRGREALSGEAAAASDK